MNKNIKFPLKLVINTERIILDRAMLDDWINQMRKFMPISVLEDINSYGTGVWETKMGDDIVKTSYVMEDIN